jgi:hypothetical protein
VTCHANVTLCHAVKLALWIEDPQWFQRALFIKYACHANPNFLQFWCSKNLTKTNGRCHALLTRLRIEWEISPIGFIISIAFFLDATNSVRPRYSDTYPPFIVNLSFLTTIIFLSTRSSLCRRNACLFESLVLPLYVE